MRAWLAPSYEMSPVTSRFSSPPIRCARPGVPGIAHGRAPCSSRAYGSNGSSVASANFGSISCSASGSGIRHGSLELARKRSVSRITGVR